MINCFLDQKLLLHQKYMPAYMIISMIIVLL